MSYDAFRALSPTAQIGLLLVPGILLLVLGLALLGGVVIGVGALLIVLALVLWPLLTADDDAAR